MNSEQYFHPLDPVAVGIRGRCPRCGKGHMLEGFLKLAPQCEVCGLDYSFADPADGPAFFAICLGSLPSVGFGVWLEMAHQAPLWVHLLTTLPVIMLTCILPLRPLKGWLVAAQYYHKAEEGKLDADYYDRQRAATELKGAPSLENGCYPVRMHPTVRPLGFLAR